MLIGSHISAAGGVQNAPKNSADIGGEVFQFFSRSPRGGPAPKLTPDVIKEFKHNMKKYRQAECYIHAPYYINLASSKNSTYYSSISVLSEELKRGTKLGAKYMMTHLGSAQDLGETEAVKKVAKGISQILRGYKGSCLFLIEISAGAGKIIGDSFEEIASIIKQVKCQRSNVKGQVGVCFDTAHAFASGYDLSTAKSVKTTFDQFDKIIGIKKLKLIHANDSKTDMASHRDRHENIGQGQIGLPGFRALVQDKRLKNINLITETPDKELDRENIRILKKMRNKH